MIGPPTELDGFVIEGVAGRGGMGVVYRARQRRPERVVALKVIAAGLADDPQFAARFRRESSIAAQIEHPNVIPVHAVGEADGVLYIAMRFVVGTDLHSLLADERRLVPRRAAHIADQVAQALDAAHGHGLVHRDVKPANILIATAGGREHVYLSDFGLSRHIEGSQALTDSGAFVGTVDYVSPEQARGDRVDARSDVYSLGCVLFEALTGTVRFRSTTISPSSTRTIPNRRRRHLSALQIFRRRLSLCSCARWRSQRMTVTRLPAISAARPPRPCPASHFRPSSAASRLGKRRGAAGASNRATSAQRDPGCLSAFGNPTTTVACRDGPGSKPHCAGFSPTAGARRCTRNRGRHGRWRCGRSRPRRGPRRCGDAEGAK